MACLEQYKMTKQEYAEYERRVAEFSRLNDIKIVSQKYDGEYPVKNEFDYRKCECCGRDENAGERFTMVAISNTNVTYEFEFCVDCMYYAEYGQLDDMTMLDMEV
jgi:hypothetical protein